MKTVIEAILAVIFIGMGTLIAILLYTTFSYKKAAEVAEKKIASIQGQIDLLRQQRSEAVKEKEHWQTLCTNETLEAEGK